MFLLLIETYSVDLLKTLKKSSFNLLVAVYAACSLEPQALLHKQGES